VAVSTTLHRGANSQLILGVVWGHNARNNQSKLEQNMDGTEARRRSAQRSVQSQEYSPTNKSPKPRVQSQESARNAAYPNDTSTVSSRPRNCVTPGSACHAPGASTRASVTLASGGSRYTWSGYGVGVGVGVCGWGLRLGLAAGDAIGVWPSVLGLYIHVGRHERVEARGVGGAGAEANDVGGTRHGAEAEALVGLYLVRDDPRGAHRDAEAAAVGEVVGVGYHGQREAVRHL
jgi:hypothetical protein